MTIRISNKEYAQLSWHETKLRATKEAKLRRSKGAYYGRSIRVVPMKNGTKNGYGVYLRI